MGLETGVYAEGRHVLHENILVLCFEYYSIEMKQFEEFFFKDENQVLNKRISFRPTNNIVKNTIDLCVLLLLDYWIMYTRCHSESLTSLN